MYILPLYKKMTWTDMYYQFMHEGKKPFKYNVCDGSKNVPTYRIIMWHRFIMEKNNMSQGLLNSGSRSVSVENWDLLKKDSQDFKNSFQFGFLWLPSKTGMQN